MKKIMVFMMALAFPGMVLATEIRCQEQVNRQNKGLAYESDAQPVTPEEVRDWVGLGADPVESDANDLSEADVQKFADLLQRQDNLYFSFMNDAGLWIAVANAKTCKNIWTKQIVSY